MAFLSLQWSNSVNLVPSRRQVTRENMQKCRDNLTATPHKHGNGPHNIANCVMFLRKSSNARQYEVSVKYSGLEGNG